MASKISAGVLDYIKERILNFSLLPGVKISDEEIAKAFGTSRSPVRECLNRLVEQGLVEYRPNRGFSVRVFTRKDVEDQYILREALECLAVRLATQNMNETEIKEIQSLLATYPAVMQSQNLVKFNECDEHFHELIALYSKNIALYGELQNLRGKIRIMRRYDHLRTGSFQRTYDQHLKILNHMIRKETKEAVKAMSYHILHAMELVMAILPEQLETELSAVAERLKKARRASR